MPFRISSGQISNSVQSSQLLRSTQAEAISASTAVSATPNVHVGLGAGDFNQGDEAIAIGYQAGQTNQQTCAIAIGSNAGNTEQGQYSIAIGYARLGEANHQVANSISIDATGGDLDTPTQSGFFVKPVRNVDVESLTEAYVPVFYNSTTGEIVNSFGNAIFPLVAYNSPQHQGRDRTCMQVVWTGTGISTSSTSMVSRFIWLQDPVTSVNWYGNFIITASNGSNGGDAIYQATWTVARDADTNIKLASSVEGNDLSRFFVEIQWYSIPAPGLPRINFYNTTGFAMRYMVTGTIFPYGDGF